MSSLKAEDDSELENPLKERIKFLMTENELNRPYSFATRVGLSKGTFTGIWKEGRSSLHQGTINKICAATGANPAWLATGIGEMYLRDTQEFKVMKKEIFDPLQDESFKESERVGQINLKILEKSFEATDGALYSTFCMMDADDKADFILKFYSALLEQHHIPNRIDEEIFVLAVFTIELVLYYGRQKMSPFNKSDLISDIYDSYHSNAEMFKSAKEDFMEYKRKKY